MTALDDKCPHCGLMMLNEETDLVDVDGRRQHKSCWYDRLYLDLKGARERLCRAQMHVPPHWRIDLQAALDHIDMVGSAVVPDQWSKHDQPEYGGVS